MAAKITVFVGDVSEYLNKEAMKHDSSAKLINSNNYQNLLPGTYYVSIGDLENLSQFANVLRQADHIIYCPPQKWEDSILGSSDMQSWTENYLSIFATDNSKTVTNFHLDVSNKKQMLDLADFRRCDSKQIWVAGCSISHGVGVERGQRYGDLISKKLELEASFLTQAGSSIAWAADQILRSDIRPGDIVFWGITNSNRFTYWNDSTNQVCHRTIINWNKKDYSKNLIKEEFLASDHLIYQSVISVMQVYNFCSKIKAKLITATLLSGMEKFLAGLPGFLPLAGIHGKNLDDIFIDLGSDKRHPGVATHQFYADKMIEKFLKGD